MEHLIIPTLGRMDKQKTYNRLPDKFKSMVQFVVQDHEYDAMNERYPNKVLRLPKEINKLSPTRQWIWDNFYGTKHMVLDDDLIYFKHKAPATPADNVTTKWATREMTPQDFDDAFTDFDTWMSEGIHHGAFATSTVVPSEFYWPIMNNARIMTNCYFDSANLPRDLIWDRLPTAQDFDANLQLLTQGYANRISTKFRVTVAVTNEKGGCSVYRTTDLINEVHTKLQALYPDYIKLKEKEALSGPLKGLKQLACHVQWSKAYKDAVKKKQAETSILEDIFG